MQAVILASGLGTRLRPLTLTVPKSMIDINGRPFLEIQIELLKNNGIFDIVLCIAYLGNKIKDYFKNGKKFGVKITYSNGDTFFGNGGNLKKAEKFLDKEFLLLYGDSFLDIDYKDLINYFFRNKKMGTTVVYRNNPKIVGNNIEVDDNNNILNYNKEKEGSSNFVEAGVHVFKKDILGFIPDGQESSLEESLLPVLIKKKELIAYPTNKRYYDIGTFDRLEIFKKMLKN